VLGCQQVAGLEELANEIFKLGRGHLHQIEPSVNCFENFDPASIISAGTLTCSSSDSSTISGSNEVDGQAEPSV
jgi:hypothetical protein